MILARRSLYLDSQHLESWQQIQALESNKEDVRPPSPEMRFSKPTFLHPLKNFDQIVEGQSVRLETRINPVGDPTLKIQWLHNGKPISQGLQIVKPNRNIDNKVTCHFRK